MRVNFYPWLKCGMIGVLLFLLALSGSAEPFWFEARATSATTTLEPVDLDVIEAVARDIQRQWLRTQGPS